MEAVGVGSPPNIIEDLPVIHQKILDLFENPGTTTAQMIQNLIVRYSLHHLDFTNQKLGENALILLKDVLKTDTGIQFLSLKGNNLEDSTADILAQILKHNHGLRYLHLDDNKITTKGIEIMREALENTTLSCIYLNFNNIDRAGAEILAKVLDEKTKKNHHFRVEMQGNNKVGTNALKALKNANDSNNQVSNNH